MAEAMARAFWAQVRALEMWAEREAGGWEGVGGGDCWARDMERLFTVWGKGGGLVGL